MRSGNRSNQKTAVSRRVGRPRTIEVAHGSLAQLLTLIRTGRASTRRHLEHESDLSRAVIVERLATLRGLGLIEEAGRGHSGGGRAPQLVRFRSAAGIILVATVDRSSIAVGVADLHGQLLGEHHEAADFAAGPSALLDRLTTLFLWLVEEHGGKEYIWGIGVALPGPVESGDFASPSAFAADTLQEWREFEFEPELAVRFGAPVWIRGATHMMTMGELKSGDGAANMLFVKLGRTISAGMISDGRLHRGAQGAAGMIGHTPTREHSDVTCHCGSRDCLGVVAGGDAIGRAGLAAARQGRSPYLADSLARNGDITAVDVGYGAQAGDAVCAELMARCGRLIGESLATLVNLVNPALVVLGGSVAQAGDILLAAVRESVYRQSHPLVTRDLRIVRSRMGNSSGLVGTAQMVADELFASDVLQKWIAYGTPRRQPEFLDLIGAARARSRAAARAQPPTIGL
jgi:predicted NBD/HSP70 family sugar kinase